MCKPARSVRLLGGWGRVEKIGLQGKAILISGRSIGRDLHVIYSTVDD